jgi:glycosyltransferase involved in cell wall biosynthesis
MINKPELIAFCNFRVGGMKSYWDNILSNDPYHKFNLKRIFIDFQSEPNAQKPDHLLNFCDNEIFRVEPNDTIYDSAKKLSKLISNEPGAILTNTIMEHITLHLYRRKNKTIFFVCHDELYLNLAKNFEFLIDCFIAHNYFFYEKLIELLPSRRNDIRFIPYGVKIPLTARNINSTGLLNLVIIARLYESKGVKDIPEIDDLLVKNGVAVNWTIIGDGPEKAFLTSSFAQKKNMAFFVPSTNDEVLSLAQQNDIFILPSRLDGLPVSLLESMSVGCVPIISKFNDGIKRVVSESEGYVLPMGDNKAFAETIIYLHKNREHLETLSKNCRKKIADEFNIINRAKEYFDLFDEYLKLKRPSKFHLYKYGRPLDYPFIPSALREFIRKFKSIILAK